MLSDKTMFYFVVMVIAVILYNYLEFTLAGRILEKTKSRGFWLTAVMVFNSGVLILSLLLKNSTTIILYFVFIAVLFFEIYLFHKDTLLNTAFVVLASMLHVMVIRSVIVAVFSIGMGISFYSVANTRDILFLSSIVTAFLLDLAIILVIKFISSTKLKIISQHSEQRNFMVSCLALFNLCLLVNALVYSEKQGYPLLNAMQILMPLTILAGVYVILFYSINNCELLGYKEKNTELSKEINQEKEFRKSMLADSITTYEFNLTQNSMISGLDEYLDPLREKETISYSGALTGLAQKLVHTDDLDMVMQYVSPARFIEEFEQGRKEISIEYRRMESKDQYVWVKSVTNLIQDSATGDVQGLTYIKNINREKEGQLDLVYQAERDFMTGLYNKGKMTELVNTYITQEQYEGAKGALFMIDVDNFKAVNNNLGHVFGDKVLCELAYELQKKFRGYGIAGRAGGDEFIAFMKFIDQRDFVENKAREICQSFQKSYCAQGETAHLIHITGSVGIAILGKDGRTFEELYSNADVALYLSKNRGKNIYTFYEGEKFEKYKSNRNA